MYPISMLRLFCIYKPHSALDVVGRPTQLIHISDIYLLSWRWEPPIGGQLDDQHRNTNMNDKDHLVGQLTTLDADRQRPE